MAAFVAADETAAADVRARKRAEARRQFGLARSFSGRPLDRPFLVAVGGVIGSGKSTLAAALGRELAAPVVSSDRTRKRMAGLPPTARGGADLYDRAHTERTYVELVRRASIVLRSGRGVILDATFAERRWRHAAAELARVAGADVAFIEARCARPEILRARLAERRQGGTVSDATDGLLDEFMGRYEWPGASDPGPRFAVDTSASPETALREALQGLETAGIVPAAERRAS